MYMNDGNSDADFVVIAAPTNYDSKKNFFDTSAVEAVIKLVIEYNPVEKNTVAGKAAKAKEKELEEWLRDLEGIRPNFPLMAEKTRYLKENPKGVSEVCKQMEDLRNESILEGKILTLIDLVQDGTLDIEIAAAKANMTVDEFKETMGKAPLKAV